MVVCIMLMDDYKKMASRNCITLCTHYIVQNNCFSAKDETEPFLSQLFVGDRQIFDCD